MVKHGSNNTSRLGTEGDLMHKFGTVLFKKFNSKLSQSDIKTALFRKVF